MGDKDADLSVFDELVGTKDDELDDVDEEVEDDLEDEDENDHPEDEDDEDDDEDFEDDDNDETQVVDGFDFEEPAPSAAQPPLGDRRPRTLLGVGPAPFPPPPPVPVSSRPPPPPPPGSGMAIARGSSQPPLPPGSSKAPPPPPTLSKAPPPPPGSSLRPPSGLSVPPPPPPPPGSSPPGSSLSGLKAPPPPPPGSSPPGSSLSGLKAPRPPVPSVPPPKSLAPSLKSSIPPPPPPPPGPSVPPPPPPGLASRSATSLGLGGRRPPEPTSPGLGPRPISRPPGAGLPPPPPPVSDSSDIDWDDDDEVTTLFNKEQHGPSPDDLAAVTGPTLIRSQPRPQAERSAPALPLPASNAARASVPAIRFRGNRSTWLVFAALGLLVAVVVAIIALFPRAGEVVINVSGPGGIAVDQVSVMVNGTERCSFSPCPVQKLARGTYTITVSAPGYVKPAGKAVRVKGGDAQIVEFSLRPGNDQFVAGRALGSGPSTGTGIKIGELPKGMHVFVDGRDRGAPPLTVDDLKPGEHSVKISGNDRYKTWEDSVDLESGSILELEPEPTLLKGVLEVKRGVNAEGADITLECGRDRRVIEPPTKVEIEVTKECYVKATRAGFHGFAKKVAFSDEEPDQVVIVVMYPVSGGSTPTPTPPRAHAPTPTSGTGTITLSSFPPSAALVDGRPVGKTPRRVSVSAGRHSVIFVHPTKGRKATSVLVAPGQNAVAAVRF